MRRLRGEVGAATIEFVFVGVLVMVPLLYFVIAVFEVQRSSFAVTQAAREAGRALETADDVESGRARAESAVNMALTDQGLDPTNATVKYVSEGTNCKNASSDPSVISLEPESQFVVCVVLAYDMPGVPTVIEGRNNTVTGEYLAHVSPYKE